MAVIECPHCGTPVRVNEPGTVRCGHTASSGEPREWVMHEGRDVVHRCPDAT
jgi:hypothetical protein